MKWILVLFVSGSTLSCEYAEPYLEREACLTQALEMERDNPNITAFCLPLN